MSKCVCAGGGGVRPNSAEVSGGVGGIFGRLTSFNTATSQRGTGWHPLHGTGLQRGFRRHDAVGGRGGWGCTGPTGIRTLRLRQATACLKHGSRYCSLGEGGANPCHEVTHWPPQSGNATMPDDVPWASPTGALMPPQRQRGSRQVSIPIRNQTFVAKVRHTSLSCPLGSAGVLIVNVVSLAFCSTESS